jgi:hypothetical protein
VRDVAEQAAHAAVLDALLDQVERLRGYVDAHPLADVVVG